MNLLSPVFRQFHPFLFHIVLNIFFNHFFPTPCISADGNPYNLRSFLLRNSGCCQSGLGGTGGRSQENIIKLKPQFLLLPDHLMICIDIRFHGYGFISFPIDISIDIIRFTAPFLQSIHGLLNCLPDIDLSTGDRNHTHSLNQTAVTVLLFFLNVILIIYHITGNLFPFACNRKNPAKIRMVIAIDNHAITIFLFHVFQESAGKPDFIAAK